MRPDSPPVRRLSLLTVGGYGDWQGSWDILHPISVICSHGNAVSRQQDVGEQSKPGSEEGQINSCVRVLLPRGNLAISAWRASAEEPVVWQGTAGDSGCRYKLRVRGNWPLLFNSRRRRAGRSPLFPHYHTNTARRESNRVIKPFTTKSSGSRQK